MSYRVVNSKICLATVYDRFNIDYSDWEGRSPAWIENALSDMKIHRNYENVELTKEVIDHKIELPCDIKLLDYIVKHERREKDIENPIGEFENNHPHSDIDTYPTKYTPGSINEKEHLHEIRLTKSFFSPIHTNGYDKSGHGHNHNTYRLLGNNYLSFPFEKGWITLYYKRTPVEIDEKTRLEFPLIPDVDSLIEAISWFILIRILQRGHIHPIYSLSSQDPFTNPLIIYNGSDDRRHGRIVGYKIKAKNDCSLLDRDAQNQISTVNRNLIIDGDITVPTRHHHEDNHDTEFIPVP
jgi:hypothetical protein